MRVSTAVVLVMGLLTACGSVAETASTEGQTQSQVVDGQEPSEETTTEAAEATDADEATETEEPEVTADLAVVDYGFTQLDGGEYGSPGVTYGAVISNNGTGIASDARAQISFKDSSGVVVDTREEYLNAVLPGASVALGDFVYDATAVETMTVQVLPGTTEELEGKPGNFTVSDVTTREQEYGGFKTTATVTSPFTRDLEDLQAVAIYRNDAGDIVGGAFTFLNFVPAGGEAAVSIDDTVDGLPTPASTEVYIAITSLTLLADM
jgi:hypothetical protein